MNGNDSTNRNNSHAKLPLSLHFFTLFICCFRCLKMQQILLNGNQEVLMPSALYLWFRSCLLPSRPCASLFLTLFHSYVEFFASLEKLSCGCPMNVMKHFAMRYFNCPFVAE